MMMTVMLVIVATTTVMVLDPGVGSLPVVGVLPGIVVGSAFNSYEMHDQKDVDYLPEHFIQEMVHDSFFLHFLSSSSSAMHLPLSVQLHW